jgi:hypothetical protein
VERVALAKRNLEDAIDRWKPPDGILVVGHKVVVDGDSIHLTLTISARGVEQTVAGEYLTWMFSDMATDALKELHRRWSDNIRKVVRRDGNVSG